MAMALREPEKFVLKPQREGGGNNVYGRDIPPFLEKMKNSTDRTGWILMSLIAAPTEKNYLIRAGSEDSEDVKNVISELGIFGVVLGYCFILRETLFKAIKYVNFVIRHFSDSLIVLFLTNY